MQDPGQIKNKVQDVLGLIAEYPYLAIPVGAFFSLLFLATSIRTLINGFAWSYDEWGWLGVLLIVSFIVIFTITALIVVHHITKPRPVIESIKTPLLSNCPTIRWKYDGPHSNTAEYMVHTRSLSDGKTSAMPVPRRMKYKELREGPFGRFSVKVAAVYDDDTERFSIPVEVEFYKDSLQRIAQTGILRVAVHADPGEDIFCFHDGADWKGFDIDLCKMIASHLEGLPSLIDSGKKIEVHPYFYKWPEVISSPNDFEVDFAIASISISDERRRSQNILFSSPYTASGLGAVFHKQSYQFRTDSQVDLAELTDMPIIVHKDTTASRLFEAAKKDQRYKGKFEVMVADSNAEVMELSMNGSGGVVIYDYLRSFSLLSPGIVARKLTYELESSEDKYGLTFAPVNTPLQEEINRYINNNYDLIQDKLNQLIHRKQYVENEA